MAKDSKKNGGNDREHENALRRFINTLIKIMNKKSGKARDEFHYNKDTGHYNLLISVDEQHDEYIALGLTSEEETFGVKNMPLSQNPQKGATETSYIRNGEIIAGHKAFNPRRIKSMKISAKDIPNVKAKKRNAKKKVKQMTDKEKEENRQNNSQKGHKKKK